MKTFLKILLGIVILLILGLGGYIGYVYFSESGKRDTFEVVPDDAIYVMETNNLTKGWREVSKSKMWQHLISNPYFNDINKDVASIDSLLSNNRLIDKILRNRKLMISAHSIAGNDYDFLFVVDLQKMSKMAILKEALGMMDYSVTNYDLNGVEITELKDDLSGDKFYLAVIDNLLSISFNKEIIGKSVECRDKMFWENNPSFKMVSEDVRQKDLFNFYFNYDQLSNYMRSFMDGDDETVKMLSEILAHSAFSLDLQNERLSFDGFTNTDSVSSYLRALSKVAPGRVKAHEIISDQTAFYLSMCFDEFDEFKNRLMDEFSKDAGDEIETYEKRIVLVEKILRINLEQDFFSWIGNEIAFVKLRPERGTRIEDVVVAIHSKDIERAKQGMTHLVKQIPLKFDVVSYKNHEINFLNTKRSFMGLLFGKLFDKLEKPYFTYIEDYVVMSNSMQTLKTVIDDYVRGRTLSHKADFADFKDEFENKSNVSLFVQMPKIYASLYHFSNAEKRKGIKENKELILSFARIGFQLTSENGMFKNELIADNDDAALLDDHLEKLETQAAEELMFENLDTTGFKVTIPEDSLTRDGKLVLYYPDTINRKVYFEGIVRSGSINGIAREYYENGNLKSSINYEYGLANGVGVFYYDNNERTKKAEIDFKDDIIEGAYREYYKNGARKAVLTFDNGTPDDEAQFFYESGVLKIEGKYKDGVQHGKWLFYDENGEILSKEKWRKGSKK